MSTTNHHNEATGKLEKVVFHCDHEGCSTVSPSDQDVIAGGGLLNMGWTTRFNDTDRRNNHYCPDHKQEI